MDTDLIGIFSSPSHPSTHNTGLDAELFYVRHGNVNNFALSFVVPVPEQVDDLTFSWQSLIDDIPVSGPPRTKRR